MGRPCRTNPAVPGPPALSPKQEQALTSILTGAAITKDAQEAGVDRRALHRWLAHDARFIAALNRYQREMDDARRQRLRLLSGKAVKALEDILDDGSAPPPLRLRAATAVLKAVQAERPVGPTPEEEVELALAQEAGRQRLKRMLAGLHGRPAADLPGGPDLPG